MQVRIMLQIVGDDGTVGDAEEIATLTKVTERAEDRVCPVSERDIWKPLTSLQLWKA